MYEYDLETMQEQTFSENLKQVASNLYQLSYDVRVLMKIAEDARKSVDFDFNDPVQAPIQRFILDINDGLMDELLENTVEMMIFLENSLIKVG